MVDTVNNTTLIRSEVWSGEVKEVLQEELTLDTHIKWHTEFTDGDALTIPTLSEMTVNNYSEGAQVTLQDTHTGEYQLRIDKYYEAGIKIPDKFRHDSFYINVVNSKMIPALMRGLMEQKESDIANLQSKQTASDPNTIQGVDHRYCGTSTVATGLIALKDIAKAKLALDKARASKANRRAAIDPTVTYELGQISDVTYQDRIGANQKVVSGFGTTTYVDRLFGFDLYETLFTDVGGENITATGINSGAVDLSSDTAAPINMFMGEEALIGAMRAAPDMIDWYAEEWRSHCYHVTIRYGLDLYRPESLVCIITKG